MDNLATTRMSSKGQIVIPESIRTRLKLKEGDQFIVIGEGDVVILKAITPPSLHSFDALIEQARQQAEESGLDSADIANAVKKARAKK